MDQPNNKKAVLGAMVMLAFFATSTALSAYPISPFPRSLSNQAGVEYEGILNTWDYITTPAYYTMQERDALSAVFTKDQTDDNFMFGGKTTVSLPFYWAVLIGNNDSSTVSDSGTTKITSTTKDTKMALQLGTEISGFGFALTVDRQAKGSINEDTNADTKSETYSTGSTPDSMSKTEIDLNMGQSLASGIVWGVGMGYSMLGGADEETSGGVTAKDAGGDKEMTGMEFKTFGWLPVSKRGDLVGWSISAISRNGKGDDKLNDGTTANPVTTEYKYLNPEATVYYTLALPLKKGTAFYVNPELSYSLVNEETTNTQGSSKSKSETETNRVFFNLPIVFSVNVTESLVLNAGWYPKLQLYGKQKETTTPATGSKTSNTYEDGAFKISSRNYGLGLTWNADENLKIHVLADSSADKADAARISFGADYLFGQAAAK